MQAGDKQLSMNNYQWDKGMLRKITINLLILSSITFSGEINYSNPDKFPLHKEMVPAVNFWINVYELQGWTVAE